MRREPYHLQALQPQQIYQGADIWSDCRTFPPTKASQRQHRASVLQSGAIAALANRVKAGIWSDPTTKPRQPHTDPFIEQGQNPTHNRKVGHCRRLD